MPGSNGIFIPPTSITKDADIRDQQCTKNDLISMANEIFGMHKWSHSVTSQTLDFVEHAAGKYQVGCSAFVKVQLPDGTFHEELGYSNSEGPNKGSVIFSARTGSITNALKNTLLCFGGDIATKIQNSMKTKNDSSISAISAIGEPQKIVTPKVMMVPNAQSSPRTTPSPRRDVLGKTFSSDNQEVSSAVNNEEPKIRSPRLKSVENFTKVEKAAMTEEERRLERKRRQAQKQEEYKRALKEKELGEKPNPRF